MRFRVPVEANVTVRPRGPGLGCCAVRRKRLTEAWLHLASGNFVMSRPRPPTGRSAGGLQWHLSVCISPLSLKRHRDNSLPSPFGRVAGVTRATGRVLHRGANPDDHVMPPDGGPWRFGAEGDSYSRNEMDRRLDGRVRGSERRVKRTKTEWRSFGRGRCDKTADRRAFCHQVFTTQRNSLLNLCQVKRLCMASSCEGSLG